MKTEVYNNTQLSIEEIDKLPVLGETINNWRQRRIILKVHPNNEERLISVGTTFDGLVMVIADEPRSDWTTALEYSARGKIYTSN